jgi:diphthamide synthase subunit DPH2
MKGLALEYVVKWIILLSVALIVISLMVYFSDYIKRWLKGQTSEGKVEVREITKDYFSSGEILAYALSCWDKTGEKYREDAICYILKGDFSNVDTYWIEDEFVKRYPTSPPSIDIQNFDTTKDIVIIKFREFDKTIVISN